MTHAVCLQRKDIVNGENEPTDEECDWPSDTESEDNELAEEAQQKLAIEPSSEDETGESWVVAGTDRGR